MGGGEYNPLSDHARDAARRQTFVFSFDAAAEPQSLPYRLRSLGRARDRDESMIRFPVRCPMEDPDVNSWTQLATPRGAPFGLLDDRARRRGLR